MGKFGAASPPGCPVFSTPNGGETPTLVGDSSFRVGMVAITPPPRHDPGAARPTCSHAFCRHLLGLFPGEPDPWPAQVGPPLGLLGGGIINSSTFCSQNGRSLKHTSYSHLTESKKNRSFLSLQKAARDNAQRQRGGRPKYLRWPGNDGERLTPLAPRGSHAGRQTDREITRQAVERRTATADDNLSVLTDAL